MTALDNQIECKKCGQSVSCDSMLEHIIEVHKDSEAAALLTILNKLSGRGT